MSLLLGTLALLVLAWIVSTFLTGTILTLHWYVIPWAYKRLTGEALNRKRGLHD